MLRFRYLIGLLFVLVGIFLLPHNALAQEEKTLIKFKDEHTSQRVADKLGLDKSEIKEVADARLFSVEEPEQKVKTKVKQETDYVEKDQSLKLFASPNDPYYSSQTHLSQIKAVQAWDYATGLSNIKIAIIDTGVNGSHEDLSSRMLAGYDCVSETAISAGADSDGYGHGTAVAGSALAVTNNSQGLAGVDWQAQIMPIKIFDDNGQGNTSDAAQGIRWAADNGAHIINLSFGQDDPSAALEEAIEYAWSKGKILVAAVGNDGKNSISYPARYEEVIAVGSVDSNSSRSSFSNYGEGLDVMAPGNSIWTTNDNTGAAKYATASGTSVSAAMVSAQAGLLLAFSPGLTMSDIKSSIEDSAVNLGAVNDYGKGLINILSSIINQGNYQHRHSSQNSYPTLDQGGSYNFIVYVVNTGRSTWSQNIVHLGTDRQRDRISGFIREGNGPSGWTSANRIQMQESSVAPGQTATFSFWMKAPAHLAPGSYREYFRLVADGTTWMEDYGIYWEIIIRTPQEILANQYQHRHLSQNSYPTISQGGSYNFQLQVTNTGTATWTKGQVNLGTDRQRDRISGFIREGDGPSGWTSANRIQMQESSVAPGQTATFSFWLKAPANMPPGAYKEYFRLVADGITWLEDYGIYWEIIVQ